MWYVFSLEKNNAVYANDFKQNVTMYTANQGVAGSSPGLATYVCGDLSWNNFYSHSSASADSRRADVSFWRMYVH